ncbi:hypothetical protein GA0116948_11728 [Chitinophaga costaii]|uniref:GLPGLI family protein n=1 Tax=Chitinophaga costaii TaxID=1335309 RepID=A0A1C4FV26_9BACT|nr:hypothetical protein [Chitinophaga costaii]PUZ27219.1 hypothetical protein DCM91_08365 [Chitinophaga costaii]SCC59503.1 hypothetical protein GA0116948_11728 [Chitinophaga costaii]
MKIIVLFLAGCLTVSGTHAQFFKKAGNKIKSITHKKDSDSASVSEEGGEPTMPSDEEEQALKRSPQRANPALVISGDSAVVIDSSFDFDVSIYQEMEAYQGNQLVKDGGQEIVIYYSTIRPLFGIQLSSRSTGTRNQYYGDFEKLSLLSLTAYQHVGTGQKQPMSLEAVEPAYPGDFGYLGVLLKTGNKKVIAGVACEEFLARNDNHVTNTNRGGVTAHVWIPMDPRTLFPGYGYIPKHFQDEIETLRTQGGYAPFIFPLEMYLEYGNGDKVYTFTNDIMIGEHRTVQVRDIVR